MRAIIVASLAACIHTSAQAPLSAADVRKVVETVVDYRVTALEDRTPINFCNVSDFWGRNGDFLGGTEMQRYASYVRRSECPKVAPRLERDVVIDHLRVRGDSVVAASTTIRGTTRILEEYVLMRMDGGKLWPVEYRIRAIVVP